MLDELVGSGLLTLAALAATVGTAIAAHEHNFGLAFLEASVALLAVFWLGRAVSALHAGAAERQSRRLE